MWYLVQFTDDKIWHICPQSSIRNLLNKNQLLVKWPSDRRWYPAQIHETAAGRYYLRKSSRSGSISQNKIIFGDPNLNRVHLIALLLFVSILIIFLGDVGKSLNPYKFKSIFLYLNFKIRNMMVLYYFCFKRLRSTFV